MTDVYKAPEAELTNPQVKGEYGSIEKALAGDYELDPVGLFKQAWAQLKGFKTPVLLAYIIYFLMIFAFAGIGTLFGIPLGTTTAGTASFATEMILTVVQTVVLMPFFVGLTMLGVKYSVTGHAKLNDAFKYYHKILPIALLTLLLYLGIGLGFLLLILPGIYLMVSFMMAYQLMADKELSAVNALKTSLKAINKKWFQMLGFMILSFVIVIIAAIPLFIGLIWAIPLVNLAYGILYRDMFGVEEATMQ